MIQDLDDSLHLTHIELFFSELLVNLDNQYLNKLHLCISPIIIGDGRNSFILEKKSNIKDFKNHKISYYKMGSDILCDIDLSIFSTKKKNQAR